MRRAISWRRDRQHQTLEVRLEGVLVPSKGALGSTAFFTRGSRGVAVSLEGFKYPAKQNG